jgi:hypothetical protein
MHVGKLIILLSLYLPTVPYALHGQSRAMPRDLEVIGRLENLSYSAIDDPEDNIGYGWITARLHISRVLRSRLSARVLEVRYFAHTYWNDRTRMRLRLRVSADGSYLVCAPRGRAGLQCR